MLYQHETDEETDRLPTTAIIALLWQSCAMLTRNCYCHVGYRCQHCNADE